MRQPEYFKFHETLCNEARELSRKKNDDYADPESRQEDRFAIFANFMQCEHLGICEVEQGFLVRLSDKMSRLSNLLKPGHEQGVMDESIRDTGLDIINYVALLLGYLETKSDSDPGGELDDIKREQEWFDDVHSSMNPTYEVLDSASLDVMYRAWSAQKQKQPVRHRFVCPVCLSESWTQRTGNVSIGECSNPECDFLWNRDAEDKYVGLV